MNRLTLIATIAASTVSTPTIAADPPAFSRMDVFELEWISSPEISPGGERIVYVRNSMDIMTDGTASRLWIVDEDGSRNVPLTGRGVNESNPAWSPDGERVAFTSEGEHGSEIFVYWIAEGVVSALTRLDKSPDGLSWSPDGSKIAFSMLVPEKPPVLVTPPDKPEGAAWPEPPRVTTRLAYEEDGAGYLEPGFKHLFVIPALGGTPRQVTSGNFHHDGRPQWADDGTSLIFSANRNDNWELDFLNSEVYRVSLGTGEVTALTDRPGPDAEPVVSPDGSRIAYWGFEDTVQAYQVSTLHVMNADGSDNRVLTADLDRSVSGLAWGGRNDRVYFQYDDRGDTKIASVDMAGRVRDIAGGLGGTTIGRPYGGGSFSVARNGVVAFTHVTPYRPAELAVTDGRRQSLLTAFNEDLLARRGLGKVEEIGYTSSVDGLEIQGWIVTPPGYDANEPHPLLVENHGGPISNYGPRFSPEIQLYAAAGYVVFYPNPRGSTGYGETFANLLKHNYPGDDYQDVMDGVDVLVESGVANEGRLYVTGGSAGGIMTAWMIGKNTRFCAAAVVKPVMNWISKTLTADNYFRYANYRFPGQPWANIETYMKFSPVSLVGNIETPTLVMVGTADRRTPLSEAKQLYGALKIRGIDTALVEIPDAPHNIAGRPSQLVAKVDHILAWFAEYPCDPATTQN